MKIRNTLIVVFAMATGMAQIAVAQEYPLDRGAALISGMLAYASQSGDLGNTSTLNFSTSVNNFVAPNFFMGGGVEYSRQGNGDHASNTFGIGPQIGYVLGSEGNSIFPYFQGGLRYYGMTAGMGIGNTTLSGSDIFLGLGLLVPIKGHLGLTIDGTFHSLNIKNDDPDGFVYKVNGNVFLLSVGIVGLLF